MLLFLLKYIDVNYLFHLLRFDCMVARWNMLPMLDEDCDR